MHLVFFSTFEELKLTARSPMDDATTKLHELSPSTPRHQFCSWPPTTMCWVECPCFPCSLMATPLPQYHTICAISKPALSRMGPPISAATPDGRRGSNAYEVNTWLWQFGRGRERLGGLSVSEVEDRREQAYSAGAQRGAETRRRREAARGGKK